VWVDDTASIEDVAKWLAWGKFANCGQTCVAPDYVLTTPEVAPRLAAALDAAITELYGPEPRESSDYGRIISERHAGRLAALLSSGTVATGGVADVSAKYVAPTVLLDVQLDEPVMQDEIFGPILPIVTVADHHAAIDVIRAREKPLALYAFTKDDSVRRALIERTSSGGVVFGSVMIHLGVSALPFGGVGHSGMGAYHGEHSIRTFSHERAVLRKLRGPDLAAIGRPPYTRRKEGMIRRS
jgi:aldehyde dehydrogenase (NAD+)